MEGGGVYLSKENQGGGDICTFAHQTTFLSYFLTSLSRKTLSFSTPTIFFPLYIKPSFLTKDSNLTQEQIQGTGLESCSYPRGGGNLVLSPPPHLGISNPFYTYIPPFLPPLSRPIESPIHKIIISKSPLPEDSCTCMTTKRPPPPHKGSLRATKLREFRFQECTILPQHHFPEKTRGIS